MERRLREILRRDPSVMLGAARDPSTPPEMLVVLSQSPSADVRAAVASNAATPAAIAEVLAGDPDADVRAAFSRRLAKLLPELEKADRGKLAGVAAAILSRLAADADLVVRRALAENICRLRSLPKDVAMQLARDVDTLVAVPICEFSPVLDDADLISLVSTSAAPGVLNAIARRAHLGADVADSLVASGDAGAIGTLLANRSAQIREATLDEIVERAAAVPLWHDALCERPEIDARLALKLAEFVADRLIARLAERADLGETVREQLADLVGHDLVRQSSSPGTRPGSPGPNEQDLIRWVADRHEGEIRSMLAARAGIDATLVSAILRTRRAKTIVALAWKAGLSMRAAEALQRFPGGIDEADCVPAAASGRYPFSDGDMEWQLGTFLTRTAPEAEAI